MHPYTTPHALFSCTSPLASLITHYRRLQQARLCEVGTACSKATPLLHVCGAAV